MSEHYGVEGFWCGPTHADFERERDRKWARNRGRGSETSQDKLE